MPDWAGLILGQIPHCTEQNSSQMPGVCPRGRWAVLALTVTVFRILEPGFCVPFQKYQNGL